MHSWLFLCVHCAVDHACRTYHHTHIMRMMSHLFSYWLMGHMYCPLYIQSAYGAPSAAFLLAPHASSADVYCPRRRISRMVPSADTTPSIITEMAGHA